MKNVTNNHRSNIALCLPLRFLFYYSLRLSARFYMLPPPLLSLPAALRKTLATSSNCRPKRETVRGVKKCPSAKAKITNHHPRVITDNPR